jgi:iron(III) transport system substrate-binding protein
MNRPRISALPVSLALAASAILIFTGCRQNLASTVVIYTSQDQEYAEPILTEFTRQTGIKALAVYDSESAKTVGLVNRLMAESSRPQCDVFWNNEEFRIHQLAARDVFRVTNGWAAFGYRSRRLVINTNLVSVDGAPHSLLDLTNSAWRGKIALAYPLFGTTATHFLALRQRWGEAAWLAWCRALQANQPFMVDGNSVVVKFVGGGQAAIGMTDSDDIAAGQHEKMPIVALPLSEESLLIQNTIGITRGAPHPAAAQMLFDYLQSPPVAKALMDARAIEGESLASLTPQPLRPDWNAMLRDLEPATEMLKSIFLR